MAIPRRIWLAGGSGALLLLIAAAVIMGVAARDPHPIDRFTGSYAGRSVADPENEWAARDLRVEIRREDQGFTVEWITEIAKPDGDIERRESRIQFLPTNRENIYIAGMRRNRFGNPQPLDPIRGDPYFWASIHGDTLTVHGVHVTDDGGYELQTYERTLTDEGMTVHFKRVRDGETVRDITGTMVRQEG